MCGHHSIFFTVVPNNPSINVVIDVNLNGVDIVGYLFVKLDLFAIVTLIHINSNRFYDIIPQNISRLKLINEFNANNNRFIGSFLYIALRLSTLTFNSMTLQCCRRHSSIRSSTSYF
ncbi:Pollen-specific leucine-rich repeat extensin-like protein [Musa troglodytarum]|uniref:Pollen-specific leucine-rich repeat extensin-like protein n=2 Tax=Musa troglodytarum TaxID=320322 RepID=A0A9E7H7N8_9LILI|nr:Pollen-specific leucine-rich repeat extensin-like protein [Musa troglodytarum]